MGLVSGYSLTVCTLATAFTLSISILTALIGLLTAFYFIFNDVGFIFISAAALYLADTFVSRLALWIRRLHDTGLKGTFAFVIFIPVLGILALLFVFMSDSQPKKNAYGPYVDQKKNIRP